MRYKWTWRLMSLTHMCGIYTDLDGDLYTHRILIMIIIGLLTMNPIFWSVTFPKHATDFFGLSSKTKTHVSVCPHLQEQSSALTLMDLNFPVWIICVFLFPC